MVKKTSSFVLASLRGSTYRMRFSEVGSTRGAYPFAKIHYKGERPTQSAVCTSSLHRSLRPRWKTFFTILSILIPTQSAFANI